MFDTKVQKISGETLGTTIPNAIVKLLDIRKGDILLWELTDETMSITCRHDPDSPEDVE